MAMMHMNRPTTRSALIQNRGKGYMYLFIATDSKLFPSPHLLHLNQHQQQSKLLQSQHYQPHGVQYVHAVVMHNELTKIVLHRYVIKIII